MRTEVIQLHKKVDAVYEDTKAIRASLEVGVDYFNDLVSKQIVDETIAVIIRTIG